MKKIEFNSKKLASLSKTQLSAIKGGDLTNSNTPCGSVWTKFTRVSTCCTTGCTTGPVKPDPR
jgi:hypothetical protein